jgi:c(7)-type cytochrome triheme protein
MIIILKSTEQIGKILSPPTKNNRTGVHRMKSRLIFSILAMFLLFQSAAFAVTIRDAVFNTKNAGKVVFSHADHLHKKGLTNDCRVCHDAIFDLKKKKHYSMADMGKGKSCGACHDGKRTFALGECARCHQTKEIIYNVKATGPTGFSHKSHLAKSTDCGVCHPSVFTAGHNKPFTMADMSKGKSCGACHNGKKAFGIDSCVSCHPVKEVTFKVKETGPTLFSHKSHLEVADCSKCHPKLYSPNQKNKRVGMAAMEKGKSCGACHNSKQAFSVKECSKCHPVNELIFEDKTVGNVLFSHKFHTSVYTCVDCHKSLYPAARSKVIVSMQEMDKGRSCGFCHNGKTAFGVKEQCKACHQILSKH